MFALLKNDCLLEVFLEKQRSRTGKINQPSDLLFERLIKLHFETPVGERKDVKFVPVTINYDKVHDGESFPLELLGE